MIYFGTNLDSKGGKGNSLNLFTLTVVQKVLTFKNMSRIRTRDHVTYSNTRSDA